MSRDLCFVRQTIGLNVKRKIAAIMAADIAGYSRLVAANEEATLTQLASYRAVFDDFVSKVDGRIFNTAGDAILAEFSSAVEAVRSAIDIQECLRSRNSEYPADRQMNFRIGVTIGDVVERDGDLLGDGVNIAARLQSIAEPGGISVSRTVYEQVGNKVSLQFIDLGKQGLKNIPTPIHVYRIAMKSSELNRHSRRVSQREISGKPLRRYLAVLRRPYVRDQSAKLNQSHHVQRQQREVKQHHRVNVGEKSIRREQHVARNREQSQWKHRFHAEGQEDKRGSGKTENINEVQNIPHVRPRSQRHLRNRDGSRSR